MVRVGTPKLSFAQRVCIDVLACGKTTSEASRLVGVTRSVVSEWVNHDPDFQQALTDKTQELASCRAAELVLA